MERSGPIAVAGFETFGAHWKRTEYDFGPRKKNLD